MTQGDRWLRARQIYRAVAIFQPITPWRLAKILGISFGDVCSALPGLEKAGFLLSEDDQGQLYPWRVVHCHKPR